MAHISSLKHIVSISYNLKSSAIPSHKQLSLVVADAIAQMAGEDFGGHIISTDMSNRFHI